MQTDTEVKKIQAKMDLIIWLLAKANQVTEKTLEDKYKEFFAMEKKNSTTFKKEIKKTK